MSFFYDEQRTLERIYKSRNQIQEQYFSRQYTNKPPNPLLEIAEQVYASSPIDFGETLTQNLQMEQRRTLQTTHSEHITQRTTLAGIRTKKQIFEFGNPEFKFEKVPVRFVPLQGKSGIQLVLEESGMTSKSNVDIEKFKKPAVSKILLTIFLPHKEEPIKLEASTDLTVSEVIERALLHRETEDINVVSDSALLNPKAYILRVAEEDGSIDEDAPALGLNRQIGGFTMMGSYYVLIRDPKFKERIKSTTLEFRHFKVMMDPQSRLFGARTGHVSVVYHPETTLEALRKIVCTKRLLSGPENYGFCLVNDSNRTILPITATLGSLGVMSLMLIEQRPNNSRSFTNLIPFKKSSSDFVELQKIVEKTLDFSSKYSEYPAFATSSFGNRTEILIAIDTEFLYTIKIEKKSTSKRKTLGRIRDISRAYCLPNKPRHFHIEFESNKQVYKFDSPNAEEICATINLLISKKQ